LGVTEREREREREATQQQQQQKASKLWLGKAHKKGQFSS